MKRFQKGIIAVLGVLGLMIQTSCEDDSDGFAFADPPYVGFTAFTTSISEKNESYIIQVANVGPVSNSDIVVNYSLDGSTAQEGVDFEFISGSGGAITIPAGEQYGSIEIMSIDNGIVDGDLNLVMIITGNNAGLGNGNNEISKTLTISIVDNDCPFDINEVIGLYSCDEPGYAVYDVNFTVYEPIENAILIDNFWDFGGTPYYILDPIEGTAELPEQTVNMGGNDFVVSGSGSYDVCAETFIVDYTIVFNGGVIEVNTHTFVKQ